jgi:uncharacterized membrane protein
MKDAPSGSIDGSPSGSPDGAPDESSVGPLAGRGERAAGPAADHPAGDAATGPSELPLVRLEAFSDGVFAIAITLLVLELAVSEDAASDLVRGILEQWPSYLAYVTSFLTIGAVWIGHSAVTGALRGADGLLYRLNLLLLLVVAFLPFPTRLVSEFIDQADALRVATAFYGITLFTVSLTASVFVRYAAQDRHLVKGHIPDEALASSAVRRPSLPFYLVAIAISLVLPIIAVLLYLAIAVYLTVPGRAVRHLLRRTG